VLACVKQLLVHRRHCQTRVVLMSATMDFKRYKDFFAACLVADHHRLEVVEIPDYSGVLRSFILQTQVRSNTIIHTPETGIHAPLDPRPNYLNP
jgi:HrpA-like RNA helicase